MSAASRVVSARSEAISVIDTLTLTSLGTVTTAATFAGIASTDVQVAPDGSSLTVVAPAHPPGDAPIVLSGAQGSTPVGITALRGCGLLTPCCCIPVHVRERQSVHLFECQFCEHVVAGGQPILNSLPPNLEQVPVRYAHSN